MCASMSRISSRRYALISSRIGCAGGEVVQTPDAAIVRIGPALQQSALLEAIDQPRDGDRFHLADRRELALRKSRLALDPREDVPLRARHAARACALVELRAHDARDVI